MQVIYLLAAIAFGAANMVQAQTAPSPDEHASHHEQPASAAALTEGEVRKIDRELGKVTLRHGPIQNLEMPAMTMVFKAADPKMLEGLKEGDKVRFAAARIDGAITVTTIEAAPK
jgi:Cu/Ag efflux protein CusF